MAIESTSRAGPATAAPGSATSQGMWGERALLVMLVGISVVVATVELLVARSSAAAAPTPREATFFAADLAAAMVLWRLARRTDAWLGTRWYACGMLVTAAFESFLWVGREAGFGVSEGDGFAGAIGVLLLVAIGAILIDLRQHVRSDAVEIASDWLLVTALVGGGMYLLLRGGTATDGWPADPLLTIGLAATGTFVITGSAVLTLWRPSKMHLALTGCVTILAAAAIAVDWARQHGLADAAPTGALVLAVAGVLAIAAVLVVEERLFAQAPREQRVNPWVRSALLTISLGGACLWLGFALVAESNRIRPLESTTLILVVATMISVRTFANQRAMIRSAGQLAEALEERERAVGSLREAVGEVAHSEARLRLLVQAAVDGIVELSSEGGVLRANEGFCRMVGLTSEEVIGKTWAEVAAGFGAAGGTSLASLPQTGQAELDADGRTLYLEARTSVLPTDPPGTLLLIRDVTASKVAEQTIRTLFQFLQDRDEDRTRYLRRTNVAIEAERNRIARDLHDGPIQGVAAASLSLEAVKMMIESGQQERAAVMMGKIRQELSEETENLRRLMSDLRPPLLEERGLVPAVRDLCGKFEKTSGIDATIHASSDGLIPSEAETIAFRVIQEALSNVTKHAGASSVSIHIEGSRGTLEVEVQDDGVGFDPASAREFLRRGKVGLASMRERTELGAGTFTVRSRPGGGTSVTARLPYDLQPPLSR